MLPANHLFSFVNCMLYLGSTLIGPQMALFLPVPFYFRPNSSEYLLVFCDLPTWLQPTMPMCIPIPFRKPLYTLHLLLYTCVTVWEPHSFVKLWKPLWLFRENWVLKLGWINDDMFTWMLISLRSYLWSHLSCTNKHILHAFSRTTLKESAWVHTTTTIKPRPLLL